MSSNVTNLDVKRHFGVEGEMAGRIKTLIYEYAEQVSLVATIGVLEVVKQELMEQAKG